MSLFISSLASVGVSKKAGGITLLATPPTDRLTACMLPVIAMGACVPGGGDLTTRALKHSLIIPSSMGVAHALSIDEVDP